MFAITEGKGFQIKFKNGFMVSVQFGPYNYCSNRTQEYDALPDPGYHTSDNAEVAVLHKGTFLRLTEYDNAKDYLSAEVVGQMIGVVQAFPNDITIMEATEKIKEIF